MYMYTYVCAHIYTFIDMYAIMYPAKVIHRSRHHLLVEGPLTDGPVAGRLSCTHRQVEAFKWCPGYRHLGFRIYLPLHSTKQAWKLHSGGMKSTGL